MKILMACVLLFSIADLKAQTPEAVNYQGTIRDASGDLMVSESITVIFELLETAATGASVYTETQTLTTNAYGGFAAVIGEGTVTAGDFSTINWSTDSYFLNVNVNGNDLGTSQFQSVPYALNAKTAENVVDPLWERDGINEVFTLDEVLIGTNSNSGEFLTVRTDELIGFQLVDLGVENLPATGDVLNIEVGAASPTNAQYIECRNAGVMNFKVDVDGSVFAEEINANATGNANLVPIAYGNITASGTVNSSGSTPNISVTTTSAGVYVITVAGETLDLTGYTVSVTSRLNLGPILTNYSIATSGVNAGKLLIYSWATASSALVNNGFSFLIYKP